jgi:hypothetical protein
MMFVTTERTLETLTAADFKSLQGTRFRLIGKSSAGNGPAVSVEAELADVSENAPGPPGASRTPFSVVFHGPIEPVFPQGIYQLEHEQFGTLELFVVPIGPNEVAPSETPAAMRYEVVFG